MKRKVLLHGPSSLMISLPPAWLKRHGIVKGAEVEILEQGDALQVVSSSDELNRKVHIDVRKLDPESVKSIIAILHKVGYEEIVVHFEDPATVTLIQERIREMLMGFELIENEKDSCTIRTIASDEVQQFKHVFRRIFLVTLELADRTLESIAQGRSETFEELLELEHTTNRLTNFCHRLLNRGTVATNRTSYHYIVSWLLESIADVYRDLIRFIRKSKFSPTPALLALAVEVNKLLKALYNVFYDYSETGMDALRARHGKVKQTLQSALASTSGDATIFLMFFSTIAQYIGESFGSITALQY